MFIPYPKEVDKNLYAKDLSDPKVFYGLPKEVKFCKSCVISNQRPSSSIEFKAKIKQKKTTIVFDENSICDACAIRLKKSEINWKEREKQLKELCDKYRTKNGKYDCLVPGSGGKDSFMQAHLLKYKYGMNPLLLHGLRIFILIGAGKIINLGFKQVLITYFLLQMAEFIG